MFSIDSEKVIYTICLLTLFVLIFLLIIYISIKYTIERQIRNKKKIDDLVINHENNLLKSQLQVQEQTFQNISREIHDNIGQKITLAKLRLNTIDTKNNSLLNSDLTDVVQMLTQVIDDLRDLSRSMNSDLIATNGLVKTLENEISQLSKVFEHNLKFSVTGNAIFLEAEMELVLFRIVQESLNNIIKHAEATQVFVDVHYKKTELEIKVVDNGKGFDTSNVSESNGLNNIRMRAKMLNGVSEIESVKGEGTQITITIPL